MKYNNTEIRTVNHHGETLYVAKDICDCLGYSRYDAFYRKIKKSEMVHVDGVYQLMKCIDKETVLHLAESSRQGINGDFTKWVDKHLFNIIEPKTQVIEEGSVVINKMERMSVSAKFSLLAWLIADGELSKDELIDTCNRMADDPFII
jgi:prophage antirepressor-like protein